MVSPLPHQLPALARHAEVLSKHPVSLEASIPGFGKTYVAGFLAAHLKRRPAIICPKAVIPHWNRALAECGVKPYFVTNYEQARLGKVPGGSWEIRGRRYKWDLPDDVMPVFDEAHRCKARTTQNSKMLMAARRAGERGVKTIIMSATAAKDPLDLYSIGYALDLHGADEQFLPWAIQYGVKKGSYDWEFFGDKDVTEDGRPFSNKIKALARLHRAIFPEHGYRATYDDIPGFPENLVEAFPVEVADPRAVDELYARVVELREMKHTAEEPIVVRLRARQMAELQKAPIIAEMIQDAIDNGQSVAVFVNFIDTLEYLQEKFPKFAVVRGGQSASERQAGIDDFQGDRKRGIICQAQAGGVGISLHDVHGLYQRTSIISPPESAIMLIQILGRIHRTGAKSPAIQKMLFATNTVEARVYRNVGQKVKQIDTINDGDLDPIPYHE